MEVTEMLMVVYNINFENKSKGKEKGSIMVNFRCQHVQTKEYPDSW